MAVLLLLSTASFTAAAAEKTYPNPFVYNEENLPQPILDSHPEWIDLYYDTWKVAKTKVQFGTQGNGFVQAYMDEGFSSSFYLWDTAYITLFGKYSNGEFPSIVSLENLYRKQGTDGFIGKSYKESNGTCDYAREDDQSRNPPLLAWAEWENYRVTGDASRFTKPVTGNQAGDGYDRTTKTIFQRLIDYYYWMKDWNRYENGFYWTSTRGSGMTGSPRLGCSGAADTGDGSWICLAGQMALSARCMRDIAEVLGDANNVERFEREYKELGDLINTYMWDDTDGFYYDLDKDGKVYKMKTPAAFWPLLAGVASKEQVDRMAEWLKNPEVFNRLHMVPSVEAAHPAYNPAVKWNGDVWAPMVYMTAEAFNAYSLPEVARLIAENHITNLHEVYQDSGALWEKYNADALRAGDGSKKDFVGWTGDGPIAMLIEDVIGVQVDAPGGTISWNLSQTARNGVKNLQFGDGVVSLIAEERTNAANKAGLTITSDTDFTLLVTIDGQEYTIPVAAGTNRYQAGPDQSLAAPDTSSPLFCVSEGAYLLSLDGRIILDTSARDSIRTVELGGGFYALQSLDTGKYYTVMTDNTVMAASASIVRNAKFQLLDMGDDTVALRAMANAKYLCYQGGTLTAALSSTQNTASRFILGEGTLSIDTDRQVAYVYPVSAVTLTETEPALPATVKVMYSDGGEGYLSVQWESYAWETQTTPASVTVNGSVEGYTGAVTAAVEVIAAHNGAFFGGQSTLERMSSATTGTKRVDFTKAGTVDWMHFGSPNIQAISHKKNGPNMIGEFITGGDAGYEPFQKEMPMSISWTDGSLEGKEVVRDERGSWWNKSSAAFSIKADYIKRHATIYTFYRSNANFAVKATLVDKLGEPVKEAYTLAISSETAQNCMYSVFEFDYQADPARGDGQKLKFEFQINDPGTGKFFGIYGATVSNSDAIPADILPDVSVQKLPIAPAPAVVNLTQNGPKDWIHVGSDDAGADTVVTDRKKQETGFLDAQPLGAVNTHAAASTYAYWCNGSAAQKGINVKNGVKASGSDAGWNVTAKVLPGDTVTAYFETNCAAKVEALNGATLLESNSVSAAGRYQVTYTAAQDAAYQTLTLKIKPGTASAGQEIILTNAVQTGNMPLSIDINYQSKAAVSGGTYAAQPVNLTQLGTKDWLKMGQGGITAITDTSKIRNVDLVNTTFKAEQKKDVVHFLTLKSVGPVSRIGTFTDGLFATSWTDGIPTASYSASTTAKSNVGLNFRADGNAGGGFQLGAKLSPGDVLRVYMGHYTAKSKVTISAKGVGEIFSASFNGAADTSEADIVTVTNNEPTEVELTLERLLTGTANGTPNVYIHAATITGTPEQSQAPQINTVGLRELKNYISLLNPDRYVQTLRDDIASAVSRAQDILSNPDAYTQSVVDSVFAALRDVWVRSHKSVNHVPVDKTALTQKLTDAKALYAEAVAFGKPEALLRAFSKAIDAADYDVIRSRYAMFQEVTQSLAGLEDAMASVLPGSVDKAALRETILAAGTLNQSSYTASSWAVLTEKLTEANRIESSGLSDQNDINTALENLNNAMDSLAALVTGITLDVTAKTINSGNRFTLTATAAPENAFNKSVTWSSSNATVAAVSPAGIVTGLKPGTAEITATTEDGGFTVTCAVTVQANTGVSVNTGETVAVPITLTDCDRLAGLRGTLQYDNSLLTLQSITATKGFMLVAEGDSFVAVTADGVGVSGDVIIGYAVFTSQSNLLDDVTAYVTIAPDAMVAYDETTAQTQPGIGFSKVTIVGIPPLRGDVTIDGKVDLVDAILLMQYLAGNKELTIRQLKAADVNKDGKINVGDVTIIMQMCLI